MTETKPGAENNSPILELEGVRKQFGDVVANEDVTFDLLPREVHTILGENGAGKSTLMNIIYGAYSMDEGTIKYKGNNVDFRNPEEALDRGIALVHQEFKLIPNFSVLENILIGYNDKNVFDDISRHKESIAEISQRYGLELESKLEWNVDELAEGEKQRVELLKILYRDPDILLLDEPTSFLTPQEVDQLFNVLDRLVDEGGMSIIFITHKLDEALSISDRISVLRNGVIIDTVEPAAVTESELAQMIVGDDDLEISSRLAKNGDSGEYFLLEIGSIYVENNRQRNVVDGLSLQVFEDEIVSIVGVEGNGQTEFAEAITGLRPVESGLVNLDGKDITNSSRNEVMDAGLTFIPASNGVIDDLSVADNVVLGNPRNFFRRISKDREKIMDHTDRIIQEYDVKLPSPESPISKLSGGNKQKVLLGRQLALKKTKMIVAFNPTKGVDIGTKTQIHKELIKQKEDGIPVLLITTDLNEALNISDRMGVIREGKIVKMFEDMENVSREEIGLAMTAN